MSSLIMGVVHKLRQDVVDFILEQKKTAPAISCRKLAQTIQEKFQFEISKSSVNAVIKNAALSSPVGRRASPGSTPKFMIPKEKKAELFSQLPLIILEEKPSETPHQEPSEKTQPQAQQELSIEEKIPAPEVSDSPPKEIEFKPPLEEDVEPPEAPPAAKEAVPEQPAPLKEEIKEEPIEEIEIPAEKPEVPEAKEEQPPPVEERPRLRLEPILDEQSLVSSVSEVMPPVPSEPSLPSQEAEKIETPELLSAPEVLPEPATPETKEEETEKPPPVEKKIAEENILEEKIPEKPVEPMTPVVEEAPEAITLLQQEELKIEPSPPPLTLDMPIIEEPTLAEAHEKKDFTLVVEKVEKETLEGKVILDGMGCIFLKAAEWEVSNSSVLGGLLKKYSSMYSVDAACVSQALLYLKVFGLKKIEDIENYNEKGLWELNGIKQKLGVETLTRFLESIANVKNLSVSMTNEYSQLFSEISYIRIGFPGHTDISLDARLQTVWYENSIQPIFSTPFNKALDSLQNIIHNTRPLVIRSVPGYKDFSKQFYEMIQCFENLGEKKIEQVSIFDHQRHEVAKFSAILAKKRNFVIAAWPWQEEFKNMMKEDPRLIRSFYDPALKRKIYYSESRVQLPVAMIGQAISLRVAFVRESVTDWPAMGILTNIAEDTLSIEQVISLYLSHWPNGQEGHNDFVTKMEKASFGVTGAIPSQDRVPLLLEDGFYNLLQGNPDAWANIEFFLSALNNYCERHFFPLSYEKQGFSSIRERFYSLPGFMEQAEGTLFITFVPPEAYSYGKDLEYTVARVNESDVRDQGGRRVFLRIYSQK